MGAALLGGLLDSGAFDASALAVVEVVEERRDQLSSQFPGVARPGRGAPVRRCSHRRQAGRHRLRRQLPPAPVGRRGCCRSRPASASPRSRRPSGRTSRVVRAMPNTPALVRLGACAIAAGANAGRRRRGVGALDPRGGRHRRRVDEASLDAFTGVAGSGPAYVFLVAEALIDAAVAEGLDRAVAERVVRQLLLGSATLLDREGDPTRLREMVTSPEWHDRGGSRSARRPRRTRQRSPLPFATPRNAVASSADTAAAAPEMPTGSVGNYMAVFPMCRFSHGPAWPRVILRGDASAGNGGQRRQGWCHRGVGTGPCRVRGELPTRRCRFAAWVIATRRSRSSPTTAPPTSSSASCSR